MAGFDLDCADDDDDGYVGREYGTRNRTLAGGDASRGFVRQMCAPNGVSPRGNDGFPPPPRPLIECAQSWRQVNGKGEETKEKNSAA